MITPEKVFVGGPRDWRLQNVNIGWETSAHTAGFCLGLKYFSAR